MATAAVLVVEDDPIPRALMVDLLRDEGYAVIEAVDGAEAIAVLEAWPPGAICLLVLDMGLPWVDGAGVLRHLAERGRAVPVVATSAAHLGLERARRAGATTVLPKPFDLDQFLDVVRRPCGERP